MAAWCIGDEEPGHEGEEGGSPGEEPDARGDGGRAQGASDHLPGDHQGHRGDVQRPPLVYLAHRERGRAHCKENPIYVYSFSGNYAASVPISHSCLYERLMYSQDWSTYFSEAE
jgi:hypothetical protein